MLAERHARKKYLDYYQAVCLKRMELFVLFCNFQVLFFPNDLFFCLHFSKAICFTGTASVVNQFAIVHFCYTYW